MDAGVETARKGADRRFGVLPGGGEGVDVAADAEIFAASGEDDGAYVPLRRASLRQFMKAERSEEHTSELQSLMRISYAVFCLKKTKIQIQTAQRDHILTHTNAQHNQLSNST